MINSCVVYFSASGITRNVANLLAIAIGADIYEIIPETLYTEADLDWRNPESRSSIEMKNKAFRPAMKTGLTNIEKYDYIYVGFPIWWYVAPTIINTFLESFDFSGKHIIPFATSGSSEMGNTNKELAPSCPGAVLHDGKRFNADVSVVELVSWADEIEG